MAYPLSFWVGLDVLDRMFRVRNKPFLCLVGAQNITKQQNIGGLV